MEDCKFLEAQNLKNQIHYLERLIGYLKKKPAVIGISWPEAKTEMNNGRGTDWSINTWTENHVEALPKELQEQVKELIQDKLDELNQEFKLL